VLIVAVVIAILALLGPAIGNVFSAIVKSVWPLVLTRLCDLPARAQIWAGSEGWIITQFPIKPVHRYLSFRSGS
jgi:hypothetical protein